MHHIVEIVSWALSLSIHEVLGRAKGLSWKNLQVKIATGVPPEQRYSERIGVICFVCNASLTAWALIYTPWYFLFVYPLAGIVVGVAIVETVDRAALVRYGWYIPVLGNAYL